MALSEVSYASNPSQIASLRAHPSVCDRVPSAGQDRRRRADHRRERRLRRSTDPGRAAGGRGYQQVRRHSRPEARGRGRRRRVGSQAGRLGRQQVRRRRRQIRGRPLQLGRDDPGLGCLRRERHPVHHPLGHQSEGDRQRQVGRVPHLRPRRPAGHGLGGAGARQAQGQEDRGRPRQDDLRQGPRRRGARQHAQVRRQGSALRGREHRREGLFRDRLQDQGIRRRLSDVGRSAHRGRPHRAADARPGHERQS